MLPPPTSLTRHLAISQRTWCFRLRLPPATSVLQSRRFSHLVASKAAGWEGEDFSAHGVEGLGVSLAVQAVDGELVAAIHVDSGEVCVFGFAAVLGFAHVEGEGGLE